MGVDVKDSWQKSGKFCARRKADSRLSNNPTRNAERFSFFLFTVLTLVFLFIFFLFLFIRSCYPFWAIVRPIDSRAKMMKTRVHQGATSLAKLANKARGRNGTLNTFIINTYLFFFLCLDKTLSISYLYPRLVLICEYRRYCRTKN